MRNLDPVPEEPLSVYDEIVARKHEPRRSRLRDLRPRVAAAYATYARMKPALEGLQPLALSDVESEDLLHCYSGSTDDGGSSSPRDRVYTRIRALAARCPYCTVGSTSTLDHYLPKGAYPEFSVLTLNLLPSCSVCNSPRSFRAPTGERSLIHPYFDRIPDDRLLVATVRVEGGLPGAEFAVETAHAVDRAFAALYVRHFELLSLGARYGRAADEALVEMQRTLRVWARDLGREEARAKLVEQATAEEQDLGSNHFKAALTRRAAASDEFLDCCLGGA